MASSQELICPDLNLENCFPKKFVATNEWQIIKPGQEVPEGLHYRLNFETGIKQAKLLDPNESEDNKDREMAVLVSDESNSIQEFQDEDYDNLWGNDDPVNVVLEEVTPDEGKGEGISFQQSLQNLHHIFRSSKNIESVISNNYDAIEKSLDSLIYSAHDIEFGREFTADNSNIILFFSIINNPNIAQIDIKEKLLRIIGSSIRNNEESLQNIMQYNHGGDPLLNSLISFIDIQLTSSTAKAYVDQILIKRTVGVLNALIYNKGALADFERLKIKDFLSNRFNLLNSDVKKRCINLLNDYDLLIGEHDTRSDEL
ncbi:Sil1 protein [Saccharomycopsis crataegensis]|uniref:Nucleotide exchange factor SIL1 n=1 Tax=Saccharomycopsis crataegensis TaxID=43959 RepID=A0AAV5QFR4_9ASCO|nr:Sil1 protein [Saccharomycopsis crataegensis]